VGGGRTLEPGAPPAAEVRYQIGVAAYRDDRFEDAVREFRVALEMMPRSAKLAYNLARSLERSGQTDEAITFYERYLELKPMAQDRRQIESVLIALRRQVLESRVDLVVTSTPPGVEVTLADDDSQVGVTPASLRVAPGAHVLYLTHAGYVKGMRSVEVVAGKQAEVHVVLEPLAEPERGTSWRQMGGYGALGGGALSLGVAAYFYLGVRSTVADGGELRPGELDRQRELSDELAGQQTWMWVSTGLGLALASAGVTLLLWPEDEAPSAADDAVSVRR